MSHDSSAVVVGPSRDRRLRVFTPGDKGPDVLAEACEGRMVQARDLGRDYFPGEARRRPRIAFDCAVRWSQGGVDRRGTARDVSETGAGFTVRSISRPNVGQALCVVFELTDGYEWIVDERAVVSRCDPRPDGLYDVGVRLTDLDEYPADDVPPQPRRLLV